MMQKVYAYYNAGRWKVDCPIHGKAGAVYALPYPSSPAFCEDSVYICPECHPGIIAQIRAGSGLRWDTSARATARMMARDADQIYEVIFPAEKEEIEKILAERPDFMDAGGGRKFTPKNWDGPHETLEYLREENKMIARLMAGDK